MVLLPIIAVLWTVFRTQDFSLWGFGIYQTSVLLFGYCLGCIAISPFFVNGWIRRKFFQGPNSYLIDSRVEHFDIANQVDHSLIDGFFANLLAMLPGNQATQLALEHHRLQFEQVPSPLDGLKVVHLSDFHFTGQLRVEYFQELTAIINQQEPDLILITGDLVDEARCLDWIPSVFGELRSRYGAFYVRGNHDLRIKDAEELQDRLQQVGLRHVGGRWETVKINGVSIAIAGNELPWFTGAEDLPKETPVPVDFKILLSHSPDQMEWAEPYRFDWMLAGHTHGGQIQFPIIGPIVAPSKFGVKYASGSFDLGSMLLHVSRGISGDEAIRINCLPEISVFSLS